MKKLFIVIYLICSTFFLHSQKFKTAEGGIKALKGISDYHIVFEYPSDLQIPNYKSEEDFINFQVHKREKKKIGSGKRFKKLWYENRASIYEPAFIEKFNHFKLRKRQVTVSQNNVNALHTMVIKTILIYPGYDVTAYEEEAKLEITITIYATNAKEKILYATDIVHIHGKGESHNELERILTAYEELGWWVSKHFHRKT